jgi:CHAT domain-containing protein
MREGTTGTTKAEALRQAQLQLLRGERTTEVVTTKGTQPAEGTTEVVTTKVAPTARTTEGVTTKSGMPPARQLVQEENQGTPNNPRFTPDPKNPMRIRTTGRRSY